uniref:Uncharacterized protein n=1 Tax=Timema monikensis TaxID=170555 RepID=A0A7R9E877_9NEOP|nr:unnamed protein product [Timema monikensis]
MVRQKSRVSLVKLSTHHVFHSPSTQIAVHFLTPSTSMYVHRYLDMLKFGLRDEWSEGPSPLVVHKSSRPLPPYLILTKAL